MGEREMRQLIRDRLGVKMDDEMTRYLLKMGTNPQAGSNPIHVMGGDARTGVAVRAIVPPDVLFTAVQP